jgi:hypothetical protein
MGAVMDDHGPSGDALCAILSSLCTGSARSSLKTIQLAA